MTENGFIKSEFLRIKCSHRWKNHRVLVSALKKAAYSFRYPVEFGAAHSEIHVLVRF